MHAISPSPPFYVAQELISHIGTPPPCRAYCVDFILLQLSLPQNGSLFVVAMTLVITDASTAQELFMFCKDRSLLTLVRDHAFVGAIRDFNGDLHVSEFVSVMADKFHDFFWLTAQQRRIVVEAISNQPHSLSL